MLSLGLAVACTSPLDEELVPGGLLTRSGHSIARPAGNEFVIPAQVELSDGVDEEEAVALALWNQSDFRQALAALGVAEAAVQQAGLLPNPKLIIQFPVDSKQLEWLLGWSLDALWTRPRRMASAQSQWGAAAYRVVEVGLRQVADVRSAFTEAWATSRLAEVLRARADLASRHAAIMSERAQRGEVSTLEMLTFESEARRVEEEAWSAHAAAIDARLRLLESLGADSSFAGIGLAMARPLPPARDVSALREEALRSRPELLAARSGFEAAAEQLGFEERDIVRLTALLDSNGGGDHPFEIGPGLEIELPLFDRNQAGIARATALLEQASWAYAGVRRRVDSELGRNHAAYVPALASLERWTRVAVPLFERSARLAVEAEQRGSVPYTVSLEAQGRLFAARIRSIELEAVARRALIALETSVGRRLDER